MEKSPDEQPFLAAYKLRLASANSKTTPFRGRDYRTFAENLLAKSRDTRKLRIISRSAAEIEYLLFCSNLGVGFVYFVGFLEWDYSLTNVVCFGNL